MNTYEGWDKAAKVIEKRGLSVGIFGHTHRPFWRSGATVVANAGSVGQPRGCAPVILRVRFQRGRVSGHFETIDYDVNGHLRALRESGLTESTIYRLCEFFQPAPLAKFSASMQRFKFFHCRVV